MTLPPELPFTNSALLDLFTHLNGHNNYSFEDDSDSLRTKFKEVQKTQINYTEREPRLPYHSPVIFYMTLLSIHTMASWEVSCVCWEVGGWFSYDEPTEKDRGLVYRWIGVMLASIENVLLLHYGPN